MKRLALLVVLIALQYRWAEAGLAWADYVEDIALAAVHLSTEAAVANGCAYVAQARDDSVKDLRRKIVRAGGNTAVLSFGIDEIYARVFRCPAAAPSTPPGIPPPPPGSPPPPPPGPFR